MKRYSIDRVENGLVTLVGESKDEKRMDSALFDQEPKEGAIVFMRRGRFVTLPNETRHARARNLALLRRLLTQKKPLPGSEKAGGADEGVRFSPPD